jgi:recombination protein RecA
MINENQLRELYVDRRLTTYEIAAMLNVSRRTISRYLKKYNISINRKQRKYEPLKTIPLTRQQQELVVGTLLGDGCIAPHGRKNKSYRLVIGHCQKQKEYLLWKKQVLGDLVNSVNKRIDKRGNSVMYNFTTITHNDFKFFYDLFYNNGTKIAKKHIAKYLTPYAMAVWFSDDGSRDKKKNTMRISTDNFTKSDNILLKNIIKENFDIDVKVRKYIRNNSEFYYLSLNTKNAAIMSKIIKPYIVPCMRYKTM